MEIKKVFEGLKKGKLKFKCGNCGECCRVKGHVFISRADGLRIAELLSIDIEIFFDEYVQNAGGRLRVKGTAEKPCLFLKDGKCSIYPARPAQCSKFPFWLEAMASPEGFFESSGFCAGVKKLMKS